MLKEVQKADIARIEEILQENNLPHQDVKSGAIDFFNAFNDSAFIGIIGLEKYGNIALLRSMVVIERDRNKGYGTEICKSLLAYAQSKKIYGLYLLTTTAKDFFSKVGFEAISRESVPDEIKITKEFSSLCPTSAICMYRKC